MEMTYTIDKKINEKAKKNMLYWAMASMTVFFGGFCSYYLVMHGNGNWLVFNLPALFFVSTAIIVLSSATMWWAQKAVAAGNAGGMRLGTLLTFFLGIAFCIVQVLAWGDLYGQGIVFAGKQSNVAGAILYVITAMHFLHIVGGLFALTVSSIKALANRYNSENHLGLSLTAIFWHFLGVLWVILFLFLYLNR
jgi:cytochrome c oxidase subunit III